MESATNNGGTSSPTSATTKKKSRFGFFFGRNKKDKSGGRKKRVPNSVKKRMKEDQKRSRKGTDGMNVETNSIMTEPPMHYGNGNGKGKGNGARGNMDAYKLLEHSNEQERRRQVEAAAAAYARSNGTGSTRGTGTPSTFSSTTPTRSRNQPHHHVPNTPTSPDSTATGITSASSKQTGLPVSWLARTSFFKSMVNAAFDDIDADGSNDIDEKELYSGLLLIHLKLGTYAGPAACKPISREKCHAVFLKMDADGSGRLDREEFSHVIQVLFGNVMMRVLFQYSCTLLLVPLIAKMILDGFFWSVGKTVDIVTNLDEHSIIADAIEMQIEEWMGQLTAATPVIIKQFGSTAWTYLEMVPESVWKSLPLTIISTVLSLMIIPWSLLKIDDFFQGMADQSAKRKAKKNRRESARIYHQQQYQQLQQQQQQQHRPRK